VKILTNLINLIHDSVFYVIRQHLGAYFYTTAFLYYSSLHALCHYTEKKSMFVELDTEGVLFLWKRLVNL